MKHLNDRLTDEQLAEARELTAEILRSACYANALDGDLNKTDSWYRGNVYVTTVNGILPLETVVAELEARGWHLFPPSGFMRVWYFAKEYEADDCVVIESTEGHIPFDKLLQPALRALKKAMEAEK